MIRHNHTPWPKYRKELTTAGFTIEWINETMSELMGNWECPKCNEKPPKGASEE